MQKKIVGQPIIIYIEGGPTWCILA